jgi:adenosylcobinamide-GDP ribazoletransferase
VNDGLRLALGTLTIFRTPPPRVVDQRSGSWAMTFAPLVGLLLAGVVTVFIWLPAFIWLPTWMQGRAGITPLLASALTIGLLAVLTRAIHLDGLADTADGLGSGKPSVEALDIMHRSDIGPFGVVTLVLMLMIQVVALAQHIATGRGVLATVLALMVSRLVLPLICSKGVPAARPDGLGQTVAGSVGRSQLLIAAGYSFVVLAVVAAGTVGPTQVDAYLVLRGGLVATVALLAGAGMCWWCVRRLGGVTGDVMGACVEVTFTVTLVVLTIV